MFLTVHPNQNPEAHDEHHWQERGMCEARFRSFSCAGHDNYRFRYKSEARLVWCGPERWRSAFVSQFSQQNATDITLPQLQFIHYTINSSSHSPCTPRNRTRYLFKPWSIPYTSKLPSHNIQYTLHKIASRLSEKGSAVNTKQPESHHPSINDNDS